ncbi:hypothetical protein ACFU99_15100 [Streptomyces sp. NPDC057654]|uniref:hypothetical protein n=1 Tax=Streptomyces sp. NPDC057654 TaxID=3346196 RepID=UPI0036B87ADD
MKLKQLVSDREDGPCPTVWTIEDTKHVLVQGFTVDDAEALATMGLPDNETAVRIPAALLMRAAHEYYA